MVRGQKRLALAGVDEHGVNGLAGLELYVSREARAAHADDAGVLDDLDDVVRGEPRQVALGLDGLGDGILPVVFDDHCHGGDALDRMQPRLHRRDGAADGGVDRGADEARGLADDLAHLHIIAHLDHRVGRGADVLGHGDHDLVRLRETGQGDVLGKLLALCRVDAAVITVKTAFADGLNIVVDDLEVDLVVIAELDWLVLELLQAALGGEALVDLLPGAVLVGADLALAVLRAAALAVDQALGAVHDGADAAGEVQIALGAGVAGLLRQRHAVVARVVQGIGRGDHGEIDAVRHGLDAEAAGDHDDVLRALGDAVELCQLALGLGLVAEEIELDAGRDGLPALRGDAQEFLTIRLIDRFKLLETLVAGDDKEVVLALELRRKLVDSLQLVLGVVLQFLTFLNELGLCRMDPAPAARVGLKAGRDP